MFRVRLGKISGTLILSTVFFVASTVNANGMDLWQAVQFGQQHEAVQLASKEVEERRLAKRFSLSQMLPQIRATASEAFELNKPFKSNSRSSGLRITQPIWNAGRHSNYATSKKSWQQARLEKLKIVAANIINITEAYFGVLSATSGLVLARGKVEGVKAHKRIVDVRFDIHESTILDLTETQANLDLAKVATIEAENTLENRLQQLVLYVASGDNELTPVTIDLKKIAEISDRPLSEWLQTTKQNNYDLQIARLQLTITKNNISRAKQRFYPDVNLTANWDRSWDSVFPSESKKAVLSVEIPIYLGGGRLAQLQSDYAAHERQQLQISRQIKNLRQQVTNLYRDRQSLHKRIFALQSLVVSNGKKLDATADGFARDDRTSNEVLDAQNRFIQSELDLINAVHNHIILGLKLQQTAGVLSLEDIKAVNQFYFTSADVQ